MVIVTRNQYILAQKIHHIVLNENYEILEGRNRRGKHVSVKELSYNIHVHYVPENQNTNSGNLRSDDVRECVVSLRSKVNAYKVYRDLIQQIREQMPDALFLDKALETLLGEDDLKAIKNEEEDDLCDAKEMFDDRSTRKVRIPRKAKRANKAVLRKSKARR